MGSDGSSYDYLRDAGWDCLNHGNPPGENQDRWVETPAPARRFDLNQSPDGFEAYKISSINIVHFEDGYAKVEMELDSKLNVTFEFTDLTYQSIVRLIDRIIFAKVSDTGLGYELEKIFDLDASKSMKTALDQHTQYNREFYQEDLGVLLSKYRNALPDHTYPLSSKYAGLRCLPIDRNSSLFNMLRPSPSGSFVSGGMDSKTELTPKNIFALYEKFFSCDVRAIGHDYKNIRCYTYTEDLKRGDKFWYIDPGLTAHQLENQVFTGGLVHCEVLIDLDKLPKLKRSFHPEIGDFEACKDYFLVLRRYNFGTNLTPEMIDYLASVEQNEGEFFWYEHKGLPPNSIITHALSYMEPTCGDLWDTRCIEYDDPFTASADSRKGITSLY